MSWKDERDQFDFGTPSHLGYLKMAEGDSRRDKRRCVHFDKKTGYCNRQRHNVNHNLRYCSGSSQCPRYSESSESSYKDCIQHTDASSLADGTVIIEAQDKNISLRDQYVEHVRKAIIEKALGLQWECCAVAGQGVRTIKKTHGKTMTQITKADHAARLRQVVTAMMRYRYSRFSGNRQGISKAQQFYRNALSAFLKPYASKVTDAIVLIGLSIVDDEVNGIKEVDLSAFKQQAQVTAENQAVRPEISFGKIPQQKLDNRSDEKTVSTKGVNEGIKKDYLETEDRKGLVCRYRILETGICNAPGSRNYKRVCGGAAGCPNYAEKTGVTADAKADRARRERDVSAENRENTFSVDAWVDWMRKEKKMSEGEILIELSKTMFECYLSTVNEQEDIFKRHEHEYGLLIRRGDFVGASQLEAKDRSGLLKASTKLQQVRKELLVFSRTINSYKLDDIELDNLRKRVRDALRSIPEQ